MNLIFRLFSALFAAAAFMFQMRRWLDTKSLGSLIFQTHRPKENDSFSGLGNAALGAIVAREMARIGKISVYRNISLAIAALFFLPSLFNGAAKKEKRPRQQEEQ